MLAHDVATTNDCARAPDRASANADARDASVWWSVGGPIVGLVTLIVISVLLLLLSVAQDQDRASEVRDAQLVGRSFDGISDAVAAGAMDFGIWNDAYDRITVRWDGSWVANNMYSSVFDGLVVYRADGEIRHVWTSEDYEALAEELPAAIVRGAADANVLAAIAREKEPGDMTARNYFSVEGTLVAVTVVPVSRESPEERAAGRRTPVDYVAAVDVLDVPRLERLASDVGVTALRFDLTRPAPDKGRLAIEVPGRDGAPVGWISFRNERPGTATFLRRALPIVLGLLLFGATAIAIVQRLVQRQLRAHEKAQRAAEEANVVKSQFLANMSHELRTPLNAIIGYAEMLVEAHEAEGRTQDNDDLQRIQRAGRHLLSLINDILAHSKIEAGKLELEPGDVPIAPLLADVADLVRAAAVANGTALTVDCPTDIGSACADPLRLKQCVLNLASNAVKFTQGGQVSLQAGLTRQGASPAIKIVVRDTGAGIAPQDLARLFQPFVQVDASRTRRFGGTGLGLAITRRLIEAMGGSVTAESEPGVGSTFTLIVPRQTPALRAAA